MLVSDAKFSPCRTWRYELRRLWSEKEPMVCIGLNPSTADETLNDPTIRRCIGFAKRDGFGGLVMLNLFGLRSTDPSALYTHPDPEGPGNYETIRQYRHYSCVVACWGNHSKLAGHGCFMARAMNSLHCFGLTKSGCPKHPLYLSSQTPIIPWKR